METDGLKEAIVVCIFCFLVGASTGAILGASGTITLTKEHYCLKYSNTQEYIACKNKSIQQIYSMMDGK